MAQLPNTMPNKLTDFEDWVITHATSFSVVIHYGRNNRHRTECRLLSDAIDAAKLEPRAMVYAITDEGRSVMIARKDYDRALELRISTKALGGKK